ncbi:MAG TPA: hypothetical protein DCE52_16400 [Rhodobacteraceae bacterium]|nr:hypothetical protein [Paracoccaceae bacterium]
MALVGKTYLELQVFPMIQGSSGECDYRLIETGEKPEFYDLSVTRREVEFVTGEIDIIEEWDDMTLEEASLKATAMEKKYSIEVDWLSP